MKRLLALLLALFMCISLVACGNESKKATADPTQETLTQQQLDQQREEEQENRPSQITPILYRVTDDKGNEVYLFGSIHVGREEFYPLPDYVLNAFDAADALAVEADIIAFEGDLSAQVKALQPLIYTDGTTIRDHISPEFYEELESWMRIAGTYSSALDYYCPAMWSAFLDSFMYGQVDAPSDLGIDRHLLKKAKKMEKPVVEIESAEFQYRMLADFSEELQLMMLENSLENAKDVDGLKENLQTTMDLWAAGDEEGFVDYLYEEIDTEDPDYDLILEYNKAMIEDRNIGMADYAENALASGDTVFIVVGAAHVVGPGAMAELLSQRGYTVERVQ